MSHIISSIYLFFDMREKVWKGISLVYTYEDFDRNMPFYTINTIVPNYSVHKRFFFLKFKNQLVVLCIHSKVLPTNPSSQNWRPKLKTVRNNPVWRCIWIENFIKRQCYIFLVELNKFIYEIIIYIR